MEQFFDMAATGIGTPSGGLLVLMGIGALALVGMAALALMMFRLRRVNKEMGALRRILEDSLTEPSPPADPASSQEPCFDFRQAVSDVETKKLLHEGIAGYQLPEKYGYAPSLVTRGMSPQEIAEVLQLSLEEVEQSAELARIALEAEKPSVH